MHNNNVFSFAKQMANTSRYFPSLVDSLNGINANVCSNPSEQAKWNFPHKSVALCFNFGRICWSVCYILGSSEKKLLSFASIVTLSFFKCMGDCDFRQRKYVAVRYVILVLLLTRRVPY